MGYPDGHKEKTRHRILMAAQKLLKKNGYEGASVNDVMQEAGLTRGGFYAHFKSKEDLFTHILQFSQIQDNLRDLAGNEEVAEAEKRHLVFDWYLSPSHRDQLDEACPLTLFAQQSSRLSTKPRRVLSRLIGRFANWLGEDRSKEDGIVALSMMVGAMTLARSVEDPDLADEILEANRNKLHKLFNE